MSINHWNKDRFKHVIYGFIAAFIPMLWALYFNESLHQSEKILEGDTIKTMTKINAYYEQELWKTYGTMAGYTALLDKSLTHSKEVYSEEDFLKNVEGLKETMKQGEKEWFENNPKPSFVLPMDLFF